MSRQPNTLTIVAKIKDSQSKAALGAYLKTQIDLDESGEEKEMPFYKFGGLHFASWLIVDGVSGAEETMPDHLVFEATMDGTATDFLEGLVEVAGETIVNIYRHCEGFPDTQMPVAKLIVDYLSVRMIADRAHYCGYPGRSVPQILEENALRTSVVELAQKFADPGVKIASTFGGVHRQIKAALRLNKDLRWAVNPWQPPFEVRNKKYLFVAFLVISLGLGVFLVHLGNKLISGPLVDFGQIWQFVIAYTASDGLVSDPWVSYWLKSVVSTANLANLWGISVLVWIVASVLGLWLGKLQTNYAQFSITMCASLANLVGAISGMFAIIFTWLETLAMLENLHVVSGRNFLGQQVTLLVVAIVGLAIANLFYHRHKQSIDLYHRLTIKHSLDRHRFWPTTLFDLLFWKKVIVPGLVSKILWWVKYYVWIILAFCLLAVVFSLTSWIGAIAGAILGWIPGFNNAASLGEATAHFPFGLARIIQLVLLMVLSFAWHIALVMTVGILLIFMGFFIARYMELREKKKYQSPQCLIGTIHEHRHKFAREEHGYNAYQNHLASIVEVKGGILRITTLRVVLWLVNTIARYKDNEGNLGQIPTIMSARWVLIDQGRRLLFMTNFVGGWDSYINEFSDLAGVRGVNAIWSNTFLSKFIGPDHKHQKINFPLTRFLIWGGAENEKQFKAFIRTSQVETLVWYSAYPTLSVPNINSNTKLRNGIFAELKPHQLDQFSGLL